MGGTPHNEAARGDFAKTVLMPGDPLRARFIAETFLENPRLVNNVRGIQGWTGTYQGVPVSAMASGMGMPSMGIYSHELFHFYDVDNIIRVGTTLEAAAADMAAYLATDPLLPTAFFADNDIIAVGCCRALLNAGYRIPQNVSIVGFDDTAICQFIEPQLTTMSVPKERLGALAVDRLDRLIHGTSSENIRISLVPEIMIRDSVYDFTASQPAPSGK